MLLRNPPNSWCWAGRTEDRSETTQSQITFRNGIILVARIIFLIRCVLNCNLNSYIFLTKVKFSNRLPNKRCSKKGLALFCLLIFFFHSLGKPTFLLCQIYQRYSIFYPKKKIYGISTQKFKYREKIIHSHKSPKKQNKT